MGSRIGQQLGNYHLVRLLGTGGFAEVYLGEHVHLKIERAVKVLHTVLEGDSTASFLREAQIVANLDHPHIVRVFDFEVEEHTPFLIMDYFSQGNMRRLYPKGTQLSLPAIVSYVKQLASALQYAHDKKIIHRDIKPENMLIDQHRAIAISDFGIAFMSQSSSYQNSQEIAGTAAYMAPEQLQGHPQRASDQYALGIVVYEWLLGDLPFHGSFTEIASQHLFMPPPSLSERVPTLPQEVEQVILKALEKDPQKRFESILAFASALELAYQSAPSNGVTEASRQLSPTHISPPIRNLASLQVGAGASDRMVVAGQSPPPAGNATTSQVVSPLTNILPSGGSHQSGRRISRRMVIAGLGGIAAFGISSAVITWAVSARSGRISSVPTPRTKGGTATRHTTENSPTPSSATNGAILVTYRSTGDIWTVAWSPDGKYIASSGDDPTVHIWDAKTGKDAFTYTGHVGKGMFPSVVTLAWSPDGSRIVSASSIDDQSGYKPDIQVWDVATRRLITSYNGHNPSPGHSNTIGSVAWSPDGTRIVSSGVYDGTTQIWDARTGNTIFTYLDQSPRSVWKAIWSPDGKFIASASEGSVVNGAFSSTGRGDVQVWSSDGKHISTYIDFPYGGDIVWSPDSKYIASTGSDKFIHIWEPVTGHSVHSFPGVRHIAWSSTHSIATIVLDNTVQANDTIKIFASSTGTLMSTFNGNISQVNMLAWSPDGSRLVSCSGVDNKVAIVWYW